MNRKSWIYISCSIVIVILWVFLQFIPYVEKSAQITGLTIEAEQLLQDFTNTIDMLPEILKQKEQLLSQKLLLNSKLYTKAEVLNLFNELKTKAGIQQLEVTEITPSVEELLHLNSIVPDSTQPQFLNIGLNVVGSYINFGKFVTTLEKEKYFRGINRCIIVGKIDENDEISMFIGFKALLGRTEG